MYSQSYLTTGQLADAFGVNATSYTLNLITLDKINKLNPLCRHTSEFPLSITDSCKLCHYGFNINIYLYHIIVEDATLCKG